MKILMRILGYGLLVLPSALAIILLVRLHGWRWLWTVLGLVMAVFFLIRFYYHNNRPEE